MVTFWWLLFRFHSSFNRIDTPKLYKELVDRRFAQQYSKAIIKSSAVPDPFDVIVSVIKSDPLFNHGTYQFEDADGDFVEVQIVHQKMFAHFSKQRENRLAYLEHMTEYYDMFFFHLDTFTVNDLTYLKKLLHESHIDVKIDYFPSDDVKSKLYEINRGRFFPIHVSLFSKPTAQ